MDSFELVLDDGEIGAGLIGRRSARRVSSGMPAMLPGRGEAVVNRRSRPKPAGSLGLSSGRSPLCQAQPACRQFVAAVAAYPRLAHDQLGA
jgi:hypothetical protein